MHKYYIYIYIYVDLYLLGRGCFPPAFNPVGILWSGKGGHATRPSLPVFKSFSGSCRMEGGEGFRGFHLPPPFLIHCLYPAELGGGGVPPTLFFKSSIWFMRNGWEGVWVGRYSVLV